MRERKQTNEQVVLYRFHQCDEDKKPIIVQPTRRRNDPKGYYAPVADLKDPEMKRLWIDIKASQTLIDPVYIANALKSPVTVTDFLKQYHPHRPSLENTILIEYKEPPKLPWINYGVFFLHQKEEKLYIQEVYRLAVNRLTAHRHPGVKAQYEFGEYTFEKLKYDDVPYFTHHLHYKGRPPATDQDYFFRSCPATEPSVGE